MLSNGDITRLRRQMQRRIRAVVAERRMTRHTAPDGIDEVDPGLDATESHRRQPIEG